MAPVRVSNITKIVDLGEVEFYGTLNREPEWDTWAVNGEDIEEWLYKFEGKKVRIIIKNLSSVDNSKMLEGECSD